MIWTETPEAPRCRSAAPISTVTRCERRPGVAEVHGWEGAGPVDNSPWTENPPGALTADQLPEAMSIAPLRSSDC